MVVEDIPLKAERGLRGFVAYSDLNKSATAGLWLRLSVPRRDGCDARPVYGCFDRHICGVRHVGDAHRPGRDGFHHITRHLLMAGYPVAGPIRGQRVAAGSVMIVDTARPHLVPIADARICTVQLTRAYALQVLPDIDRAHGLAHAHGCTTESNVSLAFASAFGKPSKRYRDDVRRSVPPEASKDPAAKILRWASEFDRC